MTAVHDADDYNDDFGMEFPMDDDDDDASAGENVLARGAASSPAKQTARKAQTAAAAASPTASTQVSAVQHSAIVAVSMRCLVLGNAAGRHDGRDTCTTTTHELKSAFEVQTCGAWQVLEAESFDLASEANGLPVPAGASADTFCMA